MQHFGKSNRFGVPAPKPGALPTGPHPDMKLRENARCGQICGQGNSTTFSKNFQRRYLRGFAKIKGSIQYLKQSNQFGVPAPKAGALPTALHPGTIGNYTPPQRKNQSKFAAYGENKQGGFSAPTYSLYHSPCRCVNLFLL